jgi:hypothetical protein
MGFYYCANKRQVVLDPFVKNCRLTMFIGVLFALTAAKVLNINVKSEEPPKIYKTSSGSSPGVDMSISVIKSL